MFDALRHILGIGGGHAAQAVHEPRRPIPNVPPMAQKQPVAPMAPMPVNGQVDPHSQALYDQAQRSYQAARPLSVMPVGTSPSGAGWSGVQPSTSFDGGLQGYGENDMTNGIQGGQVNRGFIPLQGSRQGSGGFTSNLQPQYLQDLFSRYR
jgi:hypothetical protein